jgi:curved DNA-binding protein
MPHECFADEIAIDFPSVGLAVERMRRSFHGGRRGDDPAEAAETVTTEVSISIEDAFRGTVVRVEVPVRVPCPACGGRGESWAEPCGRCDGTGVSLVAHGVRVPVRPGVADGSLIRFRFNSPFSGPVYVEARVALRRAV